MTGMENDVPPPTLPAMARGNNHRDTSGCAASTTCEEPSWRLSRSTFGAVISTPRMASP